MQNKMIEPGDHVVAGISGGADSVCLFYILLDLQREIAFTMQAVHVNHLLRAEAKEDAVFVGKLCLKEGVALKVFTADVGEIAREKGLSLEEAGREYRYECFQEVIKEKGSGKIAVAHHQDDRAETILFNLFRGSGLKGLSGIRPLRDNIIRPLLCCLRQEIEDYLKKRNISYLTDYSNNEDIYTRNRIRHHLIPFATEVNKEAVRHMAKTADLVWEAESYLFKQTENAFNDCAAYISDRVIVNIKKFNLQDLFLKKRILLLAIEKLKPGRQDISARHIESLLSLTITGGSRTLNLPGKLTVLKEYDSLIIKLSDKNRSSAGVLAKGRVEDLITFSDEFVLQVDENSIGREKEIIIPNIGKLFYLTFSYQKFENIPQKIYTKWFDYDKITSCALVRKRRAGDFLVVNRIGQHKKLKEYLINEKVPRVKRDDVFVLADGSHIMWVPGLRISEYYKVTDETKIVLEVRFEKN